MPSAAFDVAEFAPMRNKTGIGVLLAALVLTAGAALGAAEPENAQFVERGKFDDPDAFASLNFMKGSAELTPRTVGILAGLVDQLAAGDKSIEVVGHTSGLGNATDNQKLSEARAEAVKAWLVKHGIPLERLKVAAYGEMQPLDSNETVQGRRRNRRVDLRYAR
ncbi:MAG TPA: OmpA family protein [Verrucomicrobiae bacterium]|nr:OmpA family protein [Verrucomicrobiae bacterium]